MKSSILKKNKMGCMDIQDIMESELVVEPKIPPS